jgi:hypothetical protein
LAPLRRRSFDRAFDRTPPRPLPFFPPPSRCLFPPKQPQDKKTEIYKRIVEEMAEARPGVLALMDEALARPDVALCICSAATKAGFEKVRGGKTQAPLSHTRDRSLLLCLRAAPTRMPHLTSSPTPQPPTHPP